MSHGSKPYEPANGSLPKEERWSTAKYLRFAPEMFDAVRAKFGYDVLFCTTAITA